MGSKGSSSIFVVKLEEVQGVPCGFGALRRARIGPYSGIADDFRKILPRTNTILVYGYLDLMSPQPSLTIRTNSMPCAGVVVHVNLILTCSPAFFVLAEPAKCG